jgi:hypothetical protein
MQSMSHPHRLQPAIDDGWRSASTASIEFYELETLGGIAIIFCHRNSQHGYLACVVHAGHFMMADAHFPTVDAAKLWVAFHVIRWTFPH